MMQNKSVVVFDLDDTLCKEIDYLHSAYHEIAETIGIDGAYDAMVSAYEAGENAFATVIESYNLSHSVADLLEIYRCHRPNITLDAATQQLLDRLKSEGVVMGLISDGRSIQQRNKVEALGLERYMDSEDILISEEQGVGKPDEKLYRHLMDRYPESDFTYVGDNMKKDFVAPNRLGWMTVCLKDNGQNIHSQDIEVDEAFQPRHTIVRMADLYHLIKR